MKLTILFAVFFYIFFSCKKNIDYPNLYLTEDYKKKMDSTYSYFYSYNFVKSYDRFKLIKKKNSLNDNDKYVFACCCAMLNKKNEAIETLLSIKGEGTFEEYLYLKEDFFFENIHSDNRWNKVLFLFSNLKRKYDEKFFHPSNNEIDMIYLDDQGMRKKLLYYQYKLGSNSKKVNEIEQLIYMHGLKNVSIIEDIIAKYGWLSSQEIGNYRNGTLFLVIQHSNLEKQKKYLPLLTQAVKDSKASSKDLAYLIDRIEIQEGRKQIYGSQIGFNEKLNKYYVLPLLSPDSIDIRRKKMGLDSLNSYLKHWAIAN